MQKEVSVAVVDVGSGKISGFVANQLEGDDFSVVARAEVKCSAFYDGKWIDENDVVQSVCSVVKQLENRLGSKLSKVYVGVPGEFTAVITKQSETVYSAPKKITQDCVNEVFDNVDRFGNTQGFSPISRSSIYFVIDDDKKVIDPIGEVATKLSGLISFIFVDDSFKNTLCKALGECGVREYDFVSENLAQALYMIQPSVRDGYAVLVDSGFVSTSVSVVLGDGILYGKSFSIGGGQMADDLSQVLEIEYDEAEEVLSKVHLNLEFADDDAFAVGGRTVSASKANEIVRCRVEDIAENIDRCLKACPHILPNNVPVFITGGAFAYLKGGINALSKCLDRPVYTAPVVSPQYDKQEYASAYGLISIALSQSRPAKKGFFKKLLSSLGG